MVESATSSSGNLPESLTSGQFMEPNLLKSARQLYRAYCETHPYHPQRPVGVAVNRLTYRGKLIFSGQPVLLPEECFLSYNQIASKLW